MATSTHQARDQAGATSDAAPQAQADVGKHTRVGQLAGGAAHSASVLNGADFAVGGEASNPTIHVSAAWLVARGVNRGFVGRISGKSHPEIIGALVNEVLPLYPYVKTRGKDPLSEIPTIYFDTVATLWTTGEQELGIGRTLFAAFGLPPQQSVQVFPRDDGVEIYADTAYSYPDDKNPAGVASARSTLARIAVDELEARIGAALATAHRAKLAADIDDIFAGQSAAVVQAQLSRDVLMHYFGEQAAADQANREPTAGGAVIDLGAAGKLLILARDEAERQRVIALLEEIFGQATTTAATGDKGSVVNYEDIRLLFELDEDPRRAELLAIVREQQQGKPRDPKAWNAARIRDVLANARERLEERDADQKLGRTADAVRDGDAGLLPYPVPGEIINLSRELQVGMRAEFEFRRGATSDPREWQLGEPQFFHVSRVQIRWYAIEVDEAGAAKGAPVGTDGVSYVEGKPDGFVNQQRFRHKFDRAGRYEIHAYVQHSLFQPAHFVDTVEVVAEGDRLARLEHRRAEEWGVETARQDKVFRGVDDNRTTWDPPGDEARERERDQRAHPYARGSRAEGQLAEEKASNPAGAAADEEQRLEREIQKLEELEAQYDGGDRRSAGLRTYARDRREKLEASLARVRGAADAADTHHVQVQGNYASRTHGVSSGPLHLVSYFEFVDQRYRGTLLDHSEIVTSEHFRFQQDDENFEKMMEKLFDDLTRSYPDGAMSFAFQQYEQLAATNRFVRFTRKTDTVDKDFREAAYDDKTRMAVNLISVILSLFPPTAPLGIALSLIYNGLDVLNTLDHAVRTDTLTTAKVIDVGLLALDILPALGAASKTAQIGKRTYHVIEATQLAGSLYLLADGVEHGVRDLRDRLILSLADKREALAQLQQTNAASPEAARLAQEIRGLESDIRAAAKQVFTDVVANQGLQMASQAVVRHIAGGVFARGNGGDADDVDVDAVGRDPTTGSTKGDRVYQRNDPHSLKEPSFESGLHKIGARSSGVTHTYQGNLVGKLKVAIPGGKHEIVEVKYHLTPDYDPAAHHAGDAGPGSVELRPPAKDGDAWTADVRVSSTLGKGDLEHVVGHELDEAAEIVRRHAADPTIDIKTEHEASLFKQGAPPDARPTAHDVAAARELDSLFKAARKARHDYDAALALRNDPGGNGGTVSMQLLERHAFHVKRLQAKLEAMGFGPGVDPKARLDFIEKHASNPAETRAFVEQYQRDPVGQLPDATTAAKTILHAPHAEKLAGLGVDPAMSQRLVDKGVPSRDMIEIAEQGGPASLALLDAVITDPRHVTSAVALVNGGIARGMLPQMQAAPDSLARFASEGSRAQEVLGLLASEPPPHFEALSWLVGNSIDRSRRVSLDHAIATLDAAKKAGVDDKMLRLINSGSLRNPHSLRRFIADISDGDKHVLDLALERATTHELTIEGPAGDLATHDKSGRTPDTTIQSKLVTSPSISAFADNTYKAVAQLRGKGGEAPGHGSDRVAHIFLSDRNFPLEPTKAAIVDALNYEPNTFIGLKTSRTGSDVGWDKIEVRFATGAVIVLTPKDL